ncbi:MAG: AAA family ATPase, partial [Vulcanimicrobiaceae bacterium]
MSEALGRDDGGAGVLWSPASGQGRRPSSIYAHGVTSLATADIEIEATASANPRVRESTMHLVFSLGEGIERNDEEFVAGVRETLDRLGVGDHQYVVAVHRDTDSIHAHVALCTVDPVTYRAMDRQWLWSRIDRSMRETEVVRGWEHDRGLVIYDTGKQLIRNAVPAELKMWREERETDRLARLEIKREYLDDTFARKADATIVPRLRMAVNTLSERGERADWSDVHLVAARYGARIGQAEAEGPPSPLVLIDVASGEKIDLASVLRADLEKEIGAYRTVEEAESDFIASVEKDPNLVARRIAHETSTFSRNEIVRYLDDRISDTPEVERLADLTERHADIRIVSADTHTPIYSYAPQAELEDRLADHAKELVARTDVGFDRTALFSAIAGVEREIKSALSAEQRALVSHLDRGLLVGEGDPGTGKTVAMRVAKKYADLTGKEIVGLTISQAAANRLRQESGIECKNTTKGLMLEDLGEKTIPKNGIVILDEAGMDDSRTAEALLRICRDRNTQVIVIGDTKQLQPISAGQSLRIMRREASEAGTYEQLIGIQRQKNPWHLSAVKDLANGLRSVATTGQIDPEKITSAVKTLDKNGVFSRHDDVGKMIDRVALEYILDLRMSEKMKISPEDATIYMAASKETQRYSNEAIRQRLGLAGTGKEYITRYGTREFSVGDKITLKENKAFSERYVDGKGHVKYRA